MSEKEKEKKKKKGEKWMETQKARADEVKDKKSAWDKFGKKAQKKGIHISGYVTNKDRYRDFRAFWLTS